MQELVLSHLVKGNHNQLIGYLMNRNELTMSARTTVTKRRVETATGTPKGALSPGLKLLSSR